MINKAYKVELKPNNKQRTILKKSAGAARFAWNWALNRVRNKASKPNAFILDKEFTALVKTEFSWTYEVSRYVFLNTFKNLQDAFCNFFNKKANYPKFKSIGI